MERILTEIYSVTSMKSSSVASVGSKVGLANFVTISSGSVSPENHSRTLDSSQHRLQVSRMRFGVFFSISDPDRHMRHS